MIAAMDDAGIENAPVWHVAQRDWSIAEGNTRVSAPVAGEERLWGCWTLLPPQAGEIPASAELFARMKRERIRAVRIFPEDHRFVARYTALGSTFENMSRRRVPLFLSMEQHGIVYALADRLLAVFPGLTCVLCDLGVWGVDRFTRPLLELFPKVFLETSHLALHDSVLDELVRTYAAGRFVFGTGFPVRHPASAMLPLHHADISEEDKCLIASGNLVRLLDRVKL
jgi:predicted TIM-barrel fold metal-dependent hydrolase